MGDRSAVTVICREQDQKVFEDMGFSFAQWHGDLAEMFDQEALGGHGGQLPDDLVYYGNAAGHYTYDAFAFACDGKTYAECTTNVAGKPVVEVNSHGEVESGDLRDAQAYWTTLKEAKRLLGGRS